MVHHRIEPSDAALLELLTSDPPATNTSRKFVRRDAALDPLLLAAAAASGPHMTRNHYAHDFYPAVQLQSLQPQLDWTTWTGTEASATKEDEQKRGQARLVYKSRQAPRRERLGLTGQKDTLLEKTSVAGSPTTEPESPTSSQQISTPSPSLDSLPAVEVKCMARTRIPTPHGPVFLHLYHNNRDNKEHLALVVDPAQLADQTSTHSHIRSSSLDSKWSSSETDADRLLRGAYVGKLSSTSQHPSRPIDQSASVYHDHQIPPPLIRIHSECFTGETIGSMRCDCGEQLDEAIRQIARSQTLPTGAVIPGRGAVIYMRQEGRGIGLLSKIRAYNLQDMGHDTVTANLMLGHQADERRYDVAAAILRDLGLGSGVRVLTNNPDKLQALEHEGLTVLERVPMIPRSWQQRYKLDRDSSPATPPELDTPGATMIGGSAVSGPDLDKYLRTKVLRMGHILPLWMDGVEA